MNKRRIVILVFLILLVITIAASITLGSRRISLEELTDGLLHPSVSSYGANVVRKRVIRTVFSLLCGAALGVSGALMQAVTRNPIADPSILGVNTGAAFFVVCGIAFFHISTAGQYIVFALAGAMLAAIAVYSIGSMGRGGATPLSWFYPEPPSARALVSDQRYFTAAVLRAGSIPFLASWECGSGTIHGILTFSPLLAAGFVIALLCAPALNALALGDEAATGLGVHTKTLRLTAAAGGVLLCGSTTALAGPIGFIGLLAPHIMRLLLGSNLRLTIPLSALAGAVVLTIADVIGRLLLYPGELEVGIVTAFVGAPVLIAIAIRSKA